MSRQKAHLFRGLALLVLLFLSACGKPPTVEQQIISAIREMEAHMEAGESRAFVGWLSEDFAGQQGQMNRDQVRALMVLQLKRYQELDAQLMPITVDDRQDGRARAQFRALVTGGANWLPENGQVYEFDTMWRNWDGDWQLYSADWKPVPLDELL